MQTWQNLTEKQTRYQLDRDFYDRLRKRRPQYRAIETLIVPAGQGRAFIVQRGHVFRVVEETGAQIGSVSFWNANDRRETLKAARTMAQEGAYVKPYAQLLSSEPWVRPMITCLDEQYARPPDPDAYQRNTIGTHCSHEVIEMWFGRKARNSCRENLLKAIHAYGLGTGDLHDNVNVHQKINLADPVRGRMYLAASTAKVGDYIEFYAEMDLIVAVSACPLGDGAVDPTGDLEQVRPLRIEVLDTEIEPKAFPPCNDWRLKWSGRWTWPEQYDQRNPAK